MSAGTPLNTRKRQLRKVKMVPHGPGGQMLRPAPKVKVHPRTPQARARGRRVVQQAAQPTRYVPHGPGGQVLRPAPKVRVTPRTPQAKAHGRQVVQHSAQKVRQKETQRKARRYIMQNPVKALKKSESNAIEALSELRASNPKKYDENLKKKHVPDVVSKALNKPDPLEVGLKTVGGEIGRRVKKLSSPQHGLATISVPELAATKGSKPSKTAGKVIENAAREAVDIPANIVPSTVHIVQPAYKHPGDPKAYVKSAERFGKATTSLPLALYHHPGKTLVEHPLSTGLLVAPIPRAPGLIAGGVARRLGKMPRAEARVLPGTSMRVAEPTSKSYFKARRDAKKGPKNPRYQEALHQRAIAAHHAALEHAAGRPTVHLDQQVKQLDDLIAKEPKKLPRQVEDKHIERRIDAQVALQEDLARRAQSTTYKKAYRARKKVVPKAQARQEAADLAKKAQQKVRLEQQHVMTHGMAIRGLDGKTAIYEDHAEAAHVASEYNRVNTGGIEMVPQLTEGGYAVVPKSGVERLAEHAANTKTGPIGAGFKAYNTLWRKNVLATHPTWYAGNTIEAAVRSLASGVGPTAYVRGYRALGELKRTDPKAYAEMTGHATKGGHLTMQAHLPQETKIDVTGHGFLADTARKVQSLRDKPGVRQVADAWNNVTDFTMGTLSGKVESAFQMGMLGKELARSPLMDGHILKTSKAAIADAARGMRETHNQIALGEAVDRMYGQYGKFSPGMRKMISHYTPFIAWTLNSLKWLYHYLPADHPVLTATAASVQPYVDQWLKDKGLSAFVKGALPSFLRGSIPTKGGYARFPTRYTPFSIAAGMPEDIASSVLPQFKGSLDILQHQINWKGQKLKNPDGSPLDPNQLSVMAALTLLEGAVPASQQFIDPASHYEKGGRTPARLLKPRSGKEISNAFNPLAKVPKQKKVKKKKKGSTSLFDSPTESPSKKPKSLFDTP